MENFSNNITSEAEETKSTQQKMAEYREKSKDEMKEHQDSLIEATNPKNLKEYSQDLASSVINHNSFTRKYFDTNNAKRAYQGIDFLIKKWIATHVAIGIMANEIIKKENKTNIEQSLNSVLNNLKNPENSMKIALEKARTPEEAARLFLIQFEKSEIKNLEERSALATWLRQFAHK